MYILIMWSVPLTHANLQQGLTYISADLRAQPHFLSSLCNSSWPHPLTSDICSLISCSLIFYFYHHPILSSFHSPNSFSINLGSYKYIHFRWLCNQVQLHTHTSYSVPQSLISQEFYQKHCQRVLTVIKD